MSENVFKQARLRAAESDENFRTAEKAAAQLHDMSRERLYMIEQENPEKRQIDPTPFDVVEMAQAYKAPELCDYYCTGICPIGMGRAPLMYESLGEISANLMSSLHFLNSSTDLIYKVLADSKVTEDEREEFKKIIKTLKAISYSAQSMELWAKKNNLI